eukprot:TRINITY_DN5462_c0_g1_i1.p1 TRINITY_DN5462_c0_g1~~TRINITY_DN5462_c0_g1_i1.p1  ORF type:complete len:407 (+),score=41.74 TRINITY_DN5462_c0_g1_i1:76-1296(+)
MGAEVLILTSKATLKVVLICGAGAYLEKSKIFNKEVRKAVSEAVVNLLLPCFLFCRILKTMELDTLPNVLWLSLANLLYVSFGLLIGLGLNYMTQPARGMRSVLALVPAIGHANAIPFMLVSLICSDANGYNHEDRNRAEGYIGMYLITHSITLWGVGMNVISKSNSKAPLQNGAANGAPAAAVVGQPAEDTTPSASSPAAGDGAAEAEEEWAASVERLEIAVPPDAPPVKRRRKTCDPRSALSRCWPKWLNRPTCSAVLAALLAFVPGVRETLVYADGSLRFLYDGVERVGDAGPVLSLLAVGALFVSEGTPMPSAIGFKPLLGVLAGRLIILPACALPFWMFMRRQVSFFPKDDVFLLVICLEACTPSAYNLVTMCVLQGHGSRELSAALFYYSLPSYLTHVRQ